MSDIEYVVVMHDGSRSTKFMSEAYCKDLMEQLAAAQSQEVCTVAHDNVETCGYCQRDALAARLALAEAYIEALEQNLNDFVDLKTMDEAIAWRAANLENDAHGK